MANDPWAGILDPNEKIIWQGQPHSRLDWTGLKPVPTLMGLGFVVIGLGVAASGLVDLGSDIVPGLIQMLVGLIFAGVGLKASVGDVILDGYTRSRTWYTLTDRRVLVASQAFGKRQLRDLVLEPETGLIFEDGAPGSVLISGHKGFGFRQIDNARDVYALMRQVQRGQA